MDNGRRKYVITRGTEKSSKASIWNEVFPITLVSKQALLIRVHPEQTLPALMLTNLPHCPPTTSCCVTWSPSLATRLTQTR
jgi:hypothetical protein